MTGVLAQLVARYTSATALDEAGTALAGFPEPLLRRLVAVPVRIWLLDPGEPVASAALLDGRARRRRWLGGRLGLEACRGLTVPTSAGLLVIAPWREPAVLRHEVGHALGALLTRSDRRRLKQSFCSARQHGHLLVPLAGESIGEYLACGAAHFARPEMRSRVETEDPTLAALLAELWATTHAPQPSLARRLAAYLAPARPRAI